MEIRSILVATVTIYSGLYYLTGDLDYLTKLTFFIAIVLANAYFLVYWLLKMFSAYVKVIVQKVPFLRRKFGKFR